jgi:hypothetical protein
MVGPIFGRPVAVLWVKSRHHVKWHLINCPETGDKAGGENVYLAIDRRRTHRESHFASHLWYDGRCYPIRYSRGAFGLGLDSAIMHPHVCAMTERIQVREGEHPPDEAASVMFDRNSAFSDCGGWPYVAIASNHPIKIEVYIQAPYGPEQYAHAVERAKQEAAYNNIRTVYVAPTAVGRRC